MSWELEGLIAHLLMLISCAGEYGYPVMEFVDNVQRLLFLSGTAGYQSGCINPDRLAESPQVSQGLAAIWKWILERNDISVGHDRRYNQLPIDTASRLSRNIFNILNSHTQSAEQQHGPSPVSPDQDPTGTDGLRIYASEQTMWEAITGHYIDHKRVPRSEWLLLLGIASTKAQGILQGDLGRLVDQDKRSVPKRTDALMKKGYITKRTTLVRGTKTSKMWLKSFAPPLPRDGGIGNKPEMQMNLSGDILSKNLDAVPWHARWTGESVDYIALATTIMAICKEWGVMRMQDLKAKLGVLGMRWQMKVVSKVCRFLNARDAIRYVAAKLDNKVFKDCVRFNHGLTAKDWSIFLATGKRSGKPVRAYDLQSIDQADQSLGSTDLISLRLAISAPWSMDQPLPTTIAKGILSFDKIGLTNPDIYGLTLGDSFTRYLSSMTTSMSSPHVQPHLKHLQLRSAHARVGKVASYRYTLPLTSDLMSRYGEHTLLAVNSIGAATHTSPSHDFSLLPCALESSPLGRIYSVVLSCPKARRWPRQIKSETKSNMGSNDADNRSDVTKVALGPLNSVNNIQTQTKKAFVVTLLVRRDVLQNVVDTRHLEPTILQKKHPREDVSTASAFLDKEVGKTISPCESPGQAVNVDSSAPLRSDHDHGYIRRRGARRGRGSCHGRSRRRHSHTTPSGDAAASRPWKCQKCGGTWKNDIGLKYHLEKSQTSCNTSYSPSVIPEPRGHRESSVLLSGRTGSSASQSHVVQSAMEKARIEDSGKLNLLGDSHSTKQIFLRSASSGKILRNFSMQNNYNSNPSAKNFQPSDIQSPSELINIIQLSPFGLGKTALIESRIQTRQVPHVRNQPYHDVSEMGTFGFVQDGLDGSQVFPLANETGYFKATTWSTSEQHSHPMQALVDQIPIVRSNREADSIELHVNGGSQERAHTGSQKKITTRRRTAKHEAADCVSTLILDMLSAQQGAFPGGESLWHALSQVWGDKYPDESPPKTKDCQWALSRMLKNKIVAEHWHGYQDHHGLFSKCQVITLPHLNAFSTEVMLVVENIKRRHPQLFVPIGFSAFSDDGRRQGRKDARRGRRILAGEVAVLDAPVYAAQLATKRDQGVLGGISHQFKRRKVLHNVDGSLSFARVSDVVRDRPHVKWPTRRWPPRKPNLFIPNRNYNTEQRRVDKRVKFLAPNTFIGDEQTPFEELSLLVKMDGQPCFSPGGSDRLKNAQLTSQGGAILVDPASPIHGYKGAWPYLDSCYFEDDNRGSFTMNGWMPNGDWFFWESFVEDIEKRTTATDLGNQHSTADTSAIYKFEETLKACLDAELTWADFFINQPPLCAGPYNIFVIFSSFDSSGHTTSMHHIWPLEEQHTPGSAEKTFQELEMLSASTDEEDLQMDMEVRDFKRAKLPFRSNEAQKTKRVALATRSLTTIPPEKKFKNEPCDAGRGDNWINERARIIAAFIAVRVLLGGADKAVDWGMLVSIFPMIGLGSLRRFWTTICKEEGPYIKKYTRNFQERLINAFEKDELPMMDFETPQCYDWQRLIEWAMRIPHQEEFQMPQTKQLLNQHFTLMEASHTDEDWRERFFHVQSSIFARFEAITSEPGAFVSNEVLRGAESTTSVTDISIARSWIKSLCSTEDTKYSMRQIKERFLTLSDLGPNKSSMLLREAIEQLTRQKVICRSRKPPFGGRPYKLSEWYVSTLAKVAQRVKFEDAAAFKARMDHCFKKGTPLEIPYTLNDGSMMALTNLNGTNMIKLVPVDLPDIPFGFEPGNYESRKYPKSYYHFKLRALPTETYQYNKDIHVLRTVAHEDPPSETSAGEIPQWIDFFGQYNLERWSEILGAVCFTFATRGCMTAEAVCNTLTPILDEFEARLVIEWGGKTGIFEPRMEGSGFTLGEWWWLAVPLQFNSPQ